eukprot:SAG31_NODE_287_length_18430_cov_8.127544_1_plen_102_part_00
MRIVVATVYGVALQIVAHLSGPSHVDETPACSIIVWIVREVRPFCGGVFWGWAIHHQVALPDRAHALFFDDSGPCGWKRGVVDGGRSLWDCGGNRTCDRRS